jgi:GAF domain-containing protein
MNKELSFFESGLQLVQGNGDLKRAVGELVQLAAEAGNCKAASFYIADGRNQVLKPLVTFGLPPAYVEACGNVRIGDQCCGRAVEHRKPWIVSDMLTDPLFASARDAALLSPIRAAFSVPVIDEAGECFGSLACHYGETHFPSPEEIERNTTWAGMIAHVLTQYKAAVLAEPLKIVTIPAPKQTKSHLSSEPAL